MNISNTNSSPIMDVWVSGPFESFSSFIMRWLDIDCDEFIERVTLVSGIYWPNFRYQVTTRPLIQRTAHFVILHRRRMYFFYPFVLPF